MAWVATARCGAYALSDFSVTYEYWTVKAKFGVTSCRID